MVGKGEPFKVWGGEEKASANNTLQYGWASIGAALKGQLRHEGRRTKKGERGSGVPTRYTCKIMPERKGGENAEKGNNRMKI